MNHLVPGTKNVLITGPPGVGKTTVIKKLSRGLNGGTCGFYTREIRDGGKRVGFELVSLKEDRRETLASVDFNTSYRVGRYGVKPSRLEPFLEEIENNLHEEREVICFLLDEIGKMELFSQKFRRTVMQVLDSRFPVVATIMSSSHRYADAIKSREDTRLVEVSRENRDELPGKLLKVVREQYPRSSG